MTRHIRDAKTAITDPTLTPDFKSMGYKIRTSFTPETGLVHDIQVKNRPFAKVSVKVGHPSRVETTRRSLETETSIRDETLFQQWVLADGGVLSFVQNKNNAATLKLVLPNETQFQTKIEPDGRFEQAHRKQGHWITRQFDATGTLRDMEKRPVYRQLVPLIG